jgi:hypothetical protein
LPSRQPLLYPAHTQEARIAGANAIAGYDEVARSSALERGPKPLCPEINLNPVLIASTPDTTTPLRCPPVSPLNRLPATDEIIQDGPLRTRRRRADERRRTTPPQCETLGCENSPVEAGYCAACAEISPSILNHDAPEEGHQASAASHSDTDSDRNAPGSDDTAADGTIETGADDREPPNETSDVQEALAERIDEPVVEDNDGSEDAIGIHVSVEENDTEEIHLERGSCPVANGEHGEAWMLAVHVACYLDHALKDIHTHGEALFGELLPCHHHK